MERKKIKPVEKSMRTRAKGNYVYAIKDGRSFRFTQFVWETGVPEKDGYTLDSERTGDLPAKAQVLAKAESVKNAKTEVSKEQQYKDLMAKAEGMEKDGQWGKALGLYGKAYGIKNTKALEKKMADMDKKIAEEIKAAEAAAAAGETEDGDDTDAPKDATVVAADEAFEQEDYMLALELYEAAPDQQDEHVIARIAACNEKLSA